MMRGLLATLAACLTFGASGQSLSGYAKTYAVANEEITQLQSSVRVMLDHIETSVAWQFHAELNPILSSDVASINAPTSGNRRSWRFTDSKPRLDHSSRHALYSNIDRLNLQASLEAGDLIIGRQPITFGMARIINPTDVFLPFDVRALNTEYRIGIDAIRFRHPVDALGELDIGVVLGDGARTENSATFLKYRNNAGGVDFEATLMRFAEQSLVGGGLQSALGEVGIWIEAAFVTGDVSYQRASAGLDYAFNEDVYGLIEYHFNGAGSEARDYQTNATSRAYQTGGVFLLARHYVIPAIQFQLSPLWSLQGQGIFNLSDHSIFTSFSGTFNATQNLYVDAGIYLFSGGELTEYGASPDTAYASLRYYF